MSCTEIYAVAPNGDVVPFVEIPNAWGGAMAVWQGLARRYLPGTNIGTLMLEEMRPVFALLDGDLITDWERLTLLTTCDRVVVPVAIASVVADAFDQFQDYHTVPGYLLSVSRQADELRRMLAEVPEQGWRGVCWNQTSVNGDALWYGVERDDEHVPYNVDSMDRHWYLKDPRER